MDRFNLFNTEGLGISEEYAEKLCEAQNGAYLERIVSRGQVAPEGFWYDQNTHEYVVLLTGEAKLTVEDKEVALYAGDTLFIPAHTRHRVEHTSKDEPCVWLCWHYLG